MHLNLVNKPPSTWKDKEADAKGMRRDAPSAPTFLSRESHIGLFSDSLENDSMQEASQHWRRICENSRHRNVKDQLGREI
jgi:hypothetical protein